MKTSLILPLVASIGCASLVSGDANADQIMNAAHSLQKVLVDSQEQNLFAQGSRRLTELPGEAMACLSKYPSIFSWYTKEGESCINSGATDPQTSQPLSDNVQTVAQGAGTDCGLIKSPQFLPLYECVASFPWTQFLNLMEDKSPECAIFTSQYQQAQAQQPGGPVPTDQLVESTNTVNNVCGIEIVENLCHGLKMSPCRKLKSTCLWKSRKCTVKTTRKPTSFPTAKPTKAPTEFSCGILKKMACKSRKFRSKCEWDGKLCVEKTGAPTTPPTEFGCGTLKAMACKSKEFRSLCAWNGKLCVERTGAPTSAPTSYSCDATHQKLCSMMPLPLCKKAKGMCEWKNRKCIQVL